VPVLKATPVQDGSVESVLVIRGGKVNVHRLYDVLINYLKRTTTADVPLLYSPVAFQHATLQTNRIGRIGSFLQSSRSPLQQHAEADNAFGRQQQQQRQLYSLEVEGVLFPWQIVQLCAVMRRAQQQQRQSSSSSSSSSSEFSVRLWTDSSSVNLNASQSLAHLCTLRTHACQAIAHERALRHVFTASVVSNKLAQNAPTIRDICFRQDAYRISLQ
jgi:hypothetical protein